MRSTRAVLTRSRRWLFASLGALAIAAAATALLLVSGSSAATSAGDTQPSWSGTPQQIAAAIDSTTWRDQSQARTITTAPPQPALQFPKGTTYSQAINQLYAAAGRGTLPAGTKIVAPLPDDKVVVPGDAEAGLILSLRAPYGFDVPTGIIATPLFEPTASDPRGGAPTAEEMDALLRAIRERDGAIPEGHRVAGSALMACQVVTSDAPPCSPKSVRSPLTVVTSHDDIGPVVVPKKR